VCVRVLRAFVNVFECVSERECVRVSVSVCECE